VNPAGDFGEAERINPPATQAATVWRSLQEQESKGGGGGGINFKQLARTESPRSRDAPEETPNRSRSLTKSAARRLVLARRYRLSPASPLTRPMISRPSNQTRSARNARDDGASSRASRSLREILARCESIRARLRASDRSDFVELVTELSRVSGVLRLATGSPEPSRNRIAFASRHLDATRRGFRGFREQRIIFWQRAN